MSVSLITALTIQANGAEVATYQSKEDSRYGFEIYSIIRDHYRSHLTSSAVFDSSKDAEKVGKNVLEQILKLNLNEGRRDLAETLGESASDVQAIVDASKNGR